MNKKKTYILLGVCTILIAAAIGLNIYLQQRKLQKNNPIGTNEAPGNSTNSGEAIGEGSRGAAVVQVQHYLNEKLVLAPIYDKVWPTYQGKEISELKEDGIFGPLTATVCEWWFGKRVVTINELK